LQTPFTLSAAAAAAAAILFFPSLLQHNSSTRGSKADGTAPLSSAINLTTHLTQSCNCSRFELLRKENALNGTERASHLPYQK